MSAFPNIPMAKPWFGDEEAAAVRRVLDSGWVVQGPEVAKFEKAVGDIHQLPHSVAVSSATAGLHLMFLALGLGPGDVILVPSFAWPSAANMAARCGAIPFFVDVDPLTANMTAATLRHGLEQARAKNLGRIRAVVVVHEFGLPAPMAEILELARHENLMVLEDAACSLGAVHAGQPLGHFGRMTVFSFHPRKSVSTGEGGIVVTNEPALADALRALRNHGQAFQNGQREFTSPGFNYRLTEVQAAIGLEQLKRLPGILATKKKIAAQYFEGLSEIRDLTLPANDPEHTWQTYMVTLKSPAERDRVQAFCKGLAFETGPGSVSGHTATGVWGKQFVEPADACPMSTRLATCGLALPLYAQMTAADIQRVIAGLKEALNS